jgi:hypothetical protein
MQTFFAGQYYLFAENFTNWNIRRLKLKKVSKMEQRRGAGYDRLSGSDREMTPL